MNTITRRSVATMLQMAGNNLQKAAKMLADDSANEVDVVEFIQIANKHIHQAVGHWQDSLAINVDDSSAR